MKGGAKIKTHTMKQVTINLYSFAELSEAAKRKAIAEHEEFLLSLPEEYENEDGQLVSEYRESYEDSEVIEIIEANEYLFFADGELAHVCRYVGNHPTKAGVTELNFHGEITNL